MKVDSADIDAINGRLLRAYSMFETNAGLTLEAEPVQTDKPVSERGSALVNKLFSFLDKQGLIETPEEGDLFKKEAAEIIKDPKVAGVLNSTWYAVLERAVFPLLAKFAAGDGSK